MTACSDPGLTGLVNYGNGLLQFTVKEFCSNGVCNDVSVCQIVNDSGEKIYYVPIDGPANKSKELVPKIAQQAA